MATVVQSYSSAGSVTKSTNPAVPQAQVVALTDGEGNLVGSSAGALTFLTYLSAAQASANAGTSFPTTGVTSLAVDVNVTAFTGGTGPTVTFFVERLAADGAWYRVWTSPAISAVGPFSGNIGPGQSGTATATQSWVAAVLTGTARFGWVFANAPTSVTFSASVIGRP